MKKRVLISLLEENDGLAQLLGRELAGAGLAPSIHAWDADLPKMGWAAPAKELASCHAWVIAGQQNSFADPATRKGLALAALVAQSVHGNAFPILFSPASGAIDPASLPTPLQGGESVAKGLGPKAAVQANTVKALHPEYRLVPYALYELGLWFEVGPAREPWQGAFFACGAADSDKAVPSSHGVGPAGCIPQRSTLQYPVQGMKLTMAGLDCEGWGVKNQLSPATSYYARTMVCPDLLVFGEFPDSDEADLMTISLR